MSQQKASLPLFRKILFASDFSERAREAFETACSLASAGATKLIVLHVVEQVHIVEQPVGFNEGGFPVAVAQEGLAFPDNLVQRLREVYVPGKPIDVEYLLGDGEAAEEILRVVRERGCDLIVMGTHGRTGLDRLLLGSVAEKVLRKAECPVLTVRSPFRADASGAAHGEAAAAVRPSTSSDRPAQPHPVS